MYISLKEIFLLMFNTIKSRNEAINILRNYKGINPFILSMKKDIIILGKTQLLTEHVVEYVISNNERVPKAINKIIKISDWYGSKLKEMYEIEFTPEKLQILVLLGDTTNAFHCSVKYRKNMNPIDLFIPKKALLGNFLIEDYHNIYIDFDRYDRISMSKDPNRRIKPHQKEAVQFLLSRKKCILADDMGLGKSLELSVASIEGNFDSVIIICPASLKTNWKKELMWYVPERDITIIESPVGMTKAELEKFLGYKEGRSGMTVKELQEEAKDNGKWADNRFVIVNYDILEEFYKIPVTRSKENIQKALEKSPMLQYIMNKKSLIIVDEAHRLSNNTSIRYKIIKDLIKRGNPDSIYLATGTPITNNPQNLYCVLQFLDDPITNDWQYYMDRYCGAMKIPAKGEKERYTNMYLQRKNKASWFDLTQEEKDDLKKYIKDNARHITIAKDGTNLEELKLRISHIYLRRTKEDLSSGLPNKTIHEVFYDFNMLQRMEYSKLWDEYETAQLEADPTKEINKELLEGAIYRKYCSNQMVPNTIKMTDNFISQGEKVIIATCYDEELNMLKDYYGDKCVVYNGKMNQKQKDTAQKAFMEDPNVMVFIGQVIAAGVGLTLTASRTLIFNNIDFVPGNDRQMEDRIYRIGQTRDVNIYYQIFRGTQYEKMWNLVMKKELVINQVIKKENEK
jgi:SWI/SNF-related matrix-associated actin-dependent regulator 1 of chromatin subfamily A